MNAASFLQLDRVIHERGRLAIMSLLAATEELPFIEIRDALEMTDGNVTTHLRTLQEAGYIAVTKSFQKGRPHTTAALTGPGRRAFRQHVDLLARIVEQARSRPAKRQNAASGGRLHPQS
ncbi:MAG: ArsR family transcriptional regulator [Pedosphaera sp.]|nr:ArsR family transcriptional regulator [Pedosphaera sp.]